MDLLSIFAGLIGLGLGPFHQNDLGASLDETPDAETSVFGVAREFDASTSPDTRF